MVGLHLYVEGGGDSNYLRTKCRQGFSSFLRRIPGLDGNMPRIVACGGRQQAYDRFQTALRTGQHEAMLLVDSEEPVQSPSPWQHLSQRPGDNWVCPAGATDNHCHLMVQCMESWLVTDAQTVAKFFGAGFKVTKLKFAAGSIEDVPKGDVYRRLEDATLGSMKGRYSKADHSFDLLQRIDPRLVLARSSWASRLVKVLVENGGPTNMA